MSEETSEARSQGARALWVRALYMLLFALIYSVAEVVILVVVVLQFFIVLLAGSANLRLLMFGKSLSVFVYQILRFLTFNSDRHPYPFGPWPSAGSGPN